MAGIPPVFVELKANVSEFKAKMGEAHAEVEHLSKSGGDNLAKLQAVGQGVFLGLAGAAAAFGAMSIKAGLDQEAANARLTTALHNAGSALTSFSEPVEHTETSMRKLGFTNADTTDGLAKLTNATHSPTEAIKDMALAADIARGRHIDLAAATDILTKVETGHVALLGRIGINTKDATGATISQEEALKRLTAMYGGQASAFADTFQGKMAVLHAQVEGVAEQVGLFLIPKIEALVSVGAGAIQWAQDHKVAAEALAAVIGGPLVVAMGVYIVQQTKAMALKIADVFTAAASAAKTFAEGMVAAGTAVYAALGPIGLLFAAVTALGIVLDHTKDKAATAGQQYAEAFISAADKTANPTATMTAKLHELQAANEDLVVSWTKSENGVRSNGQTMAAQDPVYRSNAAQIKVLQQAVDGTATSHKALGDASKISGEKLDDTTGSIDAQGTTAAKAAKSIKTYSEAVVALRDDLTSAEDKVKAFKIALDALIGAPVSEEKSKIGFLNSVQSLGDALKTNGSDFNLTSGAGRANRTALESAIDAAKSQLTAMQGRGASPAEMQAAFNQQRTGLINTLRSYGYGDTDVNNILAQEGFSSSDFNTLLTAAYPVYSAGTAGNRATAGLGAAGTAALAGASAGAGFVGAQLIMDSQVVGKIVQTAQLKLARNAVSVGLS